MNYGDYLRVHLDFDQYDKFPRRDATGTNGDDTIMLGTNRGEYVFDPSLQVGDVVPRLPKVAKGYGGNDFIVDGYFEGRSSIIEWRESGFRENGKSDYGAYGGDARISGGAGDDLIVAGWGNDTVFAGPGDDIIAGDEVRVRDVGISRADASLDELAVLFRDRTGNPSDAHYRNAVAYGDDDQLYGGPGDDRDRDRSRRRSGRLLHRRSDRVRSAACPEPGSTKDPVQGMPCRPGRRAR